MADHVAEIALMRADDAAGVRWDAIVVGAGPAGSLTACLLARERLKVLLVERQRLPRPKVCGACVNQRAISWLELAELGELLPRLGAIPTRRFRLGSRGRSVEIDLPGGAAVSREALDTALVRAAIGCKRNPQEPDTIYGHSGEPDTGHDGRRFLAAGIV